MLPEQMERIYYQLETTESMVGAPFPRAAISPIMRLISCFDNVKVVIGNPERRVRDIRNMVKQCPEDAFIFFDEKGKEFQFSNEAWAIKHNRTFVVVRLSPEKRRIKLYARWA